MPSNKVSTVAEMEAQCMTLTGVRPTWQKVVIRARLSASRRPAKFVSLSVERKMKLAIKSEIEVPKLNQQNLA